MGAPAWVDVVLGGIGATVINLAATELRDRRKARRERTARVAEEARSISSRQEHEISDLQREVSHLKGLVEGKSS